MTMPQTIPAWKLERFALGELPPEELARLQQQLQVDADLRRRLEALRQQDAELRSKYPAAWMARQIHARADGATQPASRSSSWTWVRWGVAPLAAAALLAIVALPSTQQDSGPARFLAQGVRSKGSMATLYVHRRTPTGTEQLQDGNPARRGDLVRLQYRVAPADSVAGAVYGAILSLDGAGTVTRHLPLQGDTGALLTAGEPVSLDAAYELDDAPAWERFVLVTGDRPFVLEPVLSAMRTALAANNNTQMPPDVVLPDGLAQAGVTLLKVTAPDGSRQP